VNIRVVIGRDSSLSIWGIPYESIKTCI